MQCYTELIPPTAVTHACSLSFLGPKAQNLIIAKTSLLQIFETKTVAIPHDVSQTSIKNETDETYASERLEKLVLVGEYQLSGTVTSLAKVKALNTKSGGEALLVSFKDAKISLMEWDPEDFNPSTTSIHYYESDDLQGSPWAPEVAECYSFMTVDPSSRCAALKFGLRHLAVLPFRQLGDELVMGDYDSDLDEPIQRPPANTATPNGESVKEQTPYSASFVLTLTALDPNLIYPVDLAFLHEYREPTLGVISSSTGLAASLASERKDALSYTVFTLDLEQRARTPLLSVTGLPNDLFRLFPLPIPVGGALLLGSNEILHIDQSGKSNAIAVNEFARKSSSFAMADQSELALRLEGCVLELLDSRTGDMLLVTMDGDLAILSFKVDGRSMIGMSLRRITSEHSEPLLQSSASCSATTSPGFIFLGSEDGDSLLVRCRRSMPQLARKRSHAEMLDADEAGSENEEEVEDDDDLYAEGADNPRTKSPVQSKQNSTGEYTIKLQDRLLSLSPTSRPTFGSNRGLDRDASRPDDESLEFAIPNGRGKAGRISFLNQCLRLSSTRTLEVPKSVGAWSIQARKDSNAITTVPDREYDTLLILSTFADGVHSSPVFSLTSAGLKECLGTEFDSSAKTLDIGILAAGRWIIQVKEDALSCYDLDLKFAGISLMTDEETDTELKVVHTSFADNYALVVRDDSSVVVLEVQKSGDMEPCDLGEIVTTTKWKSGSIYAPTGNNSTPLLFLLSTGGALHIFELPNLTEPVYTAESLSFLPPRMSPGPVPRRLAARENLQEIVVADIGSSFSKSPHLIVRTDDDALTIYKPYHYPDSALNAPFTENLKWLKAETHCVSDKDTYDSEIMNGYSKSVFRAIRNHAGDSVVVVQGHSPKLITKEASCNPRVIRIGAKSLRCISSAHVADYASGLVSVSAAGDVALSQLPKEIHFGSIGWAVRHLPMSDEVIGICYHAQSRLYVVGTAQKQDFGLPEDDLPGHHEWAKESTSFRPRVNRGQLKLIQGSTGIIVDEMELDEDESIVSLEILDLEISDITHFRKPLISVGTCLVRGEDLPANGCVYLYEVLPVVPWPDRPETKFKLKLIAKEEVRGAVTAISSVGDHGFGLMVQGQKCLVRGLKEDAGLLPVAFMDMQCYVTSVKNLKGTGLLLMADALRGVWLSAFSEGPYRLSLLGKSDLDIQAITSEFLPFDKQLFILVADADCDLHVLEFNPEDPKSLAGQRLLHKSTFHLGHFPISMNLIPSTIDPIKQGLSNSSNQDTDMSDADADAQPAPLQHVLVILQSGAVGLVTPLEEQAYRRLAALQTHLTSVLDHAGGLNPRAYRAVESEGFGGRGVLDGSMLLRWHGLSSQRRAEACTRVGAEAWQVRNELGLIGGAGLGYL